MIDFFEIQYIIMLKYINQVINMEQKPQLFFFNRDKLLEGPCWDEKTNTLYCVSIKDERIYAFDTETGRVTSYETDGPVGCVDIDNDGKLLSAEKTGIFKTDLKTNKKRFVAHVYNGDYYRYNDGKLDPKGRLFVGIMGDLSRKPGDGALYRICDDEITVAVENTTISNGLGWSPDGKYMYFIDTPTKKVMRYSYDMSDGTMSDPTVFAEISNGSPDGMCVDIDGSIFVAQWGGGCVSHYDGVSGKKLGEISLPCKNVSCCAVGGKDMDTLFITTAVGAEYEPLAGGLFSVKIR